MRPAPGGADIAKGFLEGRQLRAMPNTRTAKKAMRQSRRRTMINKARKSRVRTFVRKVERAIAAGDAEAAREALKAAQPELMRGAQKGIMHKNTAARKISRLSRRIKALADGA